MTENVNKQQPEDRNFRSEEAKKKGLIQSIEQTLDTTNQLTLNAKSLSTFASNINEVIGWVRNNERNHQQGEKAVLDYLRKARIEIQTACGEFDKKGRSRIFLKTIEEGRQWLEKALGAW